MNKYVCVWVGEFRIALLNRHRQNKSYGYLALLLWSKMGFSFRGDKWTVSSCLIREWYIRHIGNWIIFILYTHGACLALPHTSPWLLRRVILREQDKTLILSPAEIHEKFSRKFEPPVNPTPWSRATDPGPKVCLFGQNNFRVWGKAPWPKEQGMAMRNVMWMLVLDSCLAGGVRRYFITASPCLIHISVILDQAWESISVTWVREKFKI